MKGVVSSSRTTIKTHARCASRTTIARPPMELVSSHCGIAGGRFSESLHKMERVPRLAHAW